jgi:hypothetical protein
MQLGATALLGLSAARLLATPVYPGVHFTIGFATGLAVVFLLLVIAMVGSFRGGRRVFWAPAIYFSWTGASALINLTRLSALTASPDSVPFVVVDELVGFANLAFFSWMMAGNRRFGPWAMRKP